MGALLLLRLQNLGTFVTAGVLSMLKGLAYDDVSK
jgi:hypothetical protein